MRLSVFTVSVPDLTPAQLIAAAKEAGLDGIEWRYTKVPDSVKHEAPSFWGNNRCTLDPNSDEAYFTALGEEVRSSGMATTALAPYLSAGDAEGTERAMIHAKAMGASMIRVGVHRYDRSRSYNELFESQLQYLQEVQRLSRLYGVKGVIETHHVTIAPSASLAHRLVESFDPDHVGVLYDPGNMVHEGYENFRLGMELLGPYLAHVHVKNAGWFRNSEGRWECRWQPFAEGWVDWKQVLRDLKAVHYEGGYGVEDFSGTLESRAMLAQFADWFRTLNDEV
ncbi:sugar phosphate isomerase/epimerase family protein [Paenibacillus thermotolerans]|uniref:sugar phosphate isomerase/epimerase family protein n=1 Tax=Paenibacillus thermotolerans TaxID=3027807 RepID=UPI002367ED8A|nr:MULTISPECIES: sugar phosphate isomerase/epimerase [unclassified Paenibacillus]